MKWNHVILQGEEEEDEDYDEGGDGNGMYDDADEVGNNGDNNGEPMEESWFWSELLPGTLTKSIIHNKYEYHRNKGFNVTIQKKTMIKLFYFFPVFYREIESS